MAFFEKIKRSLSSNGRANHLLLEHSQDYENFNGTDELNDRIASLEATINLFQAYKTKAQNTLTKQEKQLIQHASTLANNVRKYTHETSHFLDKTIPSHELETALDNVESLLNALKQKPEEYDIDLIKNQIDACNTASNSLNKDIHKYNFKASLLMIAAIAVTILAIALLTTLTGIFIPISIIGITLTAELISKVVVAACFTSAIGFSLTGTWLFTRKNDIALSFEKVSTDAEAIKEYYLPDRNVAK